MTTTQSGSEQTTGLPDETLSKIHDSAAKMAGLSKDEPKNLRESLLAISGKLVASDAPEPGLPVADTMTAATSQCRAWGFPWRHLREPKESLDLSGKWGERAKMLVGLHKSGFLVALLGDRWTGKTMMACRLARYHLARDDTFTALYVRVAEFFIAIKDSYRPNGPSESTQIEKFAEPDFLVIDELNERSDTRWEDMMLTLLIDKRYADVKDTLIISNHKPLAFKESVGQSVYRRLQQTGGQIECDWPSFREAKEPDDE